MVIQDAREYWKDKSYRAEMAQKMTAEREEKFKTEIADCYERTRLYNQFSPCSYRNSSENMEISLHDIGSVEAIRSFRKGRTAVLNFASFTSPGGQYINGSSAQEECLCEYSILYNVLRRHVAYYDQNNKEKNKGLYKNRLLYTPDIVFDENIKCDVITCAAPNNSVALRYGNFSEEENTEALTSRIKLVLDAAEIEKVDTLILGAFGCGVFKQDAAEVAFIFGKTLASGGYGFKRVIFAVPKGVNSYNYREFAKYFGE